MRILISLYSKPMRNGAQSPKDYPYAQELVDALSCAGHDIVQTVYGGEPSLRGAVVMRGKSLREIEQLLRECDVFICVDTYLQHMAHYLGIRGIVLFALSDPEYFGYHENVNLFADRKYFREFQFQPWEMAVPCADAFVKPNDVLVALTEFMKKGVS